MAEPATTIGTGNFRMTEQEIFEARQRLHKMGYMADDWPDDAVEGYCRVEAERDRWISAATTPPIEYRVSPEQREAEMKRIMAFVGLPNDYFVHAMRREHMVDCARYAVASSDPKTHRGPGG